MLSGPEVSVIIPIYNIQEYLNKCLSSVVEQTYKSLQIILVDDGSTDRSPQICDMYQKKDERIVVIHKCNEGLVGARKTGLLAATGEYICYVDGDDWIEVDMIENLVRDMEYSGAELVISNHYIDFDGKSQKIEGPLEQKSYATQEIVPTMLYTGQFYEFGVYPYVWAKLFQRKLLWDIQMNVDNKINCGEDVAVVYPYILQTQQIYVSFYAGYHYLQRENSISSNYDSDELLRNKLLIGYLQKVFGQSIYSKNLCRQLNQYAKNLFLVRQISVFDSSVDVVVLAPFGGISNSARVVVYGAGKLGQSVFRYLEEQTEIEIVKWVDKNFDIYQKMNFKVYNPEEIDKLDCDEYDYIIIAINNQKTMKVIYNSLIGRNICGEKIKYITQDFINDNDILSFV